MPGIERLSPPLGHGLTPSSPLQTTRSDAFSDSTYVAVRGGQLLRGALTQSRSYPGLSREAIGQPVRRDVDALEPAAGRALVELRTGAAFEDAGDQAGERFTDNQTEGIAVLVPADQGFECRFDPIERVGDGLALRRADGSRILDPLAEKLGVAPLDLLDPSGAKAQGLAHDLRGADDALARPAIKSRKGSAVLSGGQRLGQACRLGASSLAQGDIKNALNPVLLVVECRAGPDQCHLYPRNGHQGPKTPQSRKHHPWLEYRHGRAPRPVSYHPKRPGFRQRPTLPACRPGYARRSRIRWDLDCGGMRLAGPPMKFSSLSSVSLATDYWPLVTCSLTARHLLPTEGRKLGLFFRLDLAFIRSKSQDAND